MTEDEREPKPKPPKGKASPIPKRGDFQRLMNKTAKQLPKQRPVAKPPPQRHQRRGS